jgi:hypothetical protein
MNGVVDEAVNAFVPSLVGERPDWPDVVARAQALDPDRPRNTGFAALRRASDKARRRLGVAFRVDRRARLITFVVATALLIGAASALAVHYLGPSPGFTAGFSAREDLPPADWPSNMPRAALEHQAAYMGVSTDEYLRNMRRLRTGLTLGPGRSRGQGELYAYIGDDGTACMFLTGQGGDCVNGRAAALPPFYGVDPSLYPGYPGQTPAVAAIVADNVTSVQLDVAGHTRPLDIINNSVYADLDGLEAGDTIEVRFTFANGACNTVPLPNPHGDNDWAKLKPHEGC